MAYPVKVDRGSNSGTDIAIRFVWDDSVDAFRCQIANNAPTNGTFVDTQLRVGTPSDANDAATKGYVDGGAGRTAEAIQDIVGAMFKRSRNKYYCNLPILTAPLI